MTYKDMLKHAQYVTTNRKGEMVYKYDCKGSQTTLILKHNLELDRVTGTAILRTI